jgi:hypothetical protein
MVDVLYKEEDFDYTSWAVEVPLVDVAFFPLAAITMWVWKQSGSNNLSYMNRTTLQDTTRHILYILVVLVLC